MTMYKNQTSRNAMARRRSTTTGDRRVGFDAHACDFAWEFGWSCSDYRWSGPADVDQSAPGALSHLDRALALAG